MIKQAQTKFICITMSILLGVFSVIFFTTGNILYNSQKFSIEQTIDGTAQSVYLSDPNDDKFVHHKTIICKITPIPNTTDFEKTTWFDENCFQSNQVEQFIQTILSKRFSSGKLNNVYYKMFHSQGETLIVAFDASEVKASSSATILNVALILLVIYAALFVVVLGLSFSVFKPIKNAFNKQKQFISNASHELKTPLSIISANADVIQQELDSPWVNNIKSQTNRMSVLVEDMLTLAKMDEGNSNLKTEKFNLSDEVLNASLPFDALAFEKGKTLVIDVQPDIIYNGNKESVNQIVNILLDNAIKHASDKGEIFVYLHKEKGKIELSVSNTGSSIPSNQANKVFERFYRGDSSRTRETGGSGLGLSIAKGVADANKWKIFAQSIMNESMTITVIF